jgi:MFS family permease
MRNNITQPYQIPAYKHYLLGRLLFVFALRMVFTASSYQLFKLTNNSYYIGLAGLYEVIPAVLTALFSGVYIDRHNKKNILVLGYAAYAICCGLLIIASIVSGTNASLAISLIFTVMFLSGIIRSFVGPTGNSIIGVIVPTTLMPKAVSINSTIWLSSSIAGHAFAGFSIFLFGFVGTYIALALLVALAILFAMQLPSLPAIATNKTEPIFLALKKGFSFLWQNKNILGVMSLDLFVVLFGGAIAFIPEISEKILKVGPIGFGWLNAAIDIGALLSIVLFYFFPIKKNQGLVMLYAVACFGICIIVFGYSNIYLLSFIALFLAGIADGVSVNIRGTIMQLQTPNELRGRVAAVNTIFISSSNELGAYESGLTSKFFAAPIAIMFGGGISLLIVIIAYFLFPKLKTISY